MGKPFRYKSGHDKYYLWLLSTISSVYSRNKTINDSSMELYILEERG